MPPAVMAWGIQASRRQGRCSCSSWCFHCTELFVPDRFGLPADVREREGQHDGSVPGRPHIDTRWLLSGADSQRRGVSKMKTRWWMYVVTALMLVTALVGCAAMSPADRRASSPNGKPVACQPWTIAEAGLELDVPSGWQRLEPGWVWAPNDVDGYYVGVNWAALEPPMEAEAAMLPSPSLVLDSVPVDLLPWVRTLTQPPASRRSRRTRWWSSTKGMGAAPMTFTPQPQTLTFYPRLIRSWMPW